VGPCVWLRIHFYPRDGKVYKQLERYFPVVVDEAEVTDRYWDDVEKKVLADFGWWTLEEMLASDAFPARHHSTSCFRRSCVANILLKTNSAARLLRANQIRRVTNYNY